MVRKRKERTEAHLQIIFTRPCTKHRRKVRERQEKWYEHTRRTRSEKRLSKSKRSRQTEREVVLH